MNEVFEKFNNRMNASIDRLEKSLYDSFNRIESKLDGIRGSYTDVNDKIDGSGVRWTPQDDG